MRNQHNLVWLKNKIGFSTSKHWGYLNVMSKTRTITFNMGHEDTRTTCSPWQIGNEHFVSRVKNRSFGWLHHSRCQRNFNTLRIQLASTILSSWCEFKSLLNERTSIIVCQNRSKKIVRAHSHRATDNLIIIIRLQRSLQVPFLDLLYSN